MADRLSSIRARLAAATPGPWEVMAQDAGHSQYEMNVWVVDEVTGDIICDMDGLMRSHNERFDNDGYNDAVFIANARSDVTYLLYLIAELTQGEGNQMDSYYDGPLSDYAQSQGYERGPKPEETLNAEELAQMIADKLDPPRVDERRRNMPLAKLKELYPDPEDWYVTVEIRRSPEDKAYVVKTAYNADTDRDEKYITAASYLDIAEAVIQIFEGGI